MHKPTFTYLREVDYRGFNEAIKSPSLATTIQQIRGHSQVILAKAPCLHYENNFNLGATKIKVLNRVANLKNNTNKLLT
jgi:hypothetical protein